MNWNNNKFVYTRLETKILRTSAFTNENKKFCEMVQQIDKYNEEIEYCKLH